ncbi:aldo/keto reductase [Methanotrichaceae archaeon M04Ac]|jgi:aryl-alcohol dehydrogenase-like predicted oxidoreductase|uniref:Aldo/keto reductase n=1 Tax=Candidatus Methanocrinis alkalitolerans TaxID=3033395 RepID=A0ABT5XE27_9EURY|nr:aldo/keto reductase [Candidatus Methanocrinis alkalitolerans]MDF0592966.1 aldo/keto reductase [Candidatus Methanocrinis alkalitolerans]
MAEIRTRPFGKSGLDLTVVGLGGEGILRTFGEEARAAEVIEEAALQGIGYFDTAPAYSGSEGYYGTFWRSHPELRDRIFQTSKSASRTARGARVDLDRTLKTLGIDGLDLWQIHDVRTRQDLREIEGPGGALEAFIDAKEVGITKLIGVSGHHDPAIVNYAVQNWPVDSILIPVNPLEGVIGGFLDGTIAAAKERGIAVIGMKVLGGSHYLNPKAGIGPDLLLRYALTQEVSLIIAGCSTPDEVRILSDAGRDAEPLSGEEEERLLALFRPYARRLAFYRGVV